MTVDQILAKAKTPKLGAWDPGTVQQAIAVREELVPRVLEHMNWYYEQLQNPNWRPDRDAYYLNYNGYHLLAEMKEPRAYPVLLKCIPLPDQRLRLVFGDDLAEHLKDVLAATYDGSLAETEALVLNQDVSLLARGAVYDAMAILTENGRISREETVRIYRELIQQEHVLNGGKDPEEVTFINITLDTICNLHLHEVCVDLRDLVLDKALFDAEYADALDRIFDWPGAPREEWCPPGLNGAVDADDTDVTDDADGPTAQEMEILAYHCGRNDPCPCGSGKKFKKCHLREQEELKSKYANRQPKPKPMPKPKSIFEQLCAVDPIIYPPIENVGDKPGLAAYYPREAIEVDMHIYRGMKIENDRMIGFNVPESEHQLAREELWKAFEGFEKICQEKGYQSYGEYDRNCMVHFTAERWLTILFYNLKNAGDSRMEAVKKWL